MSEVPEIRIGTAEREEALQRLSDHFAAGRLSVAEFDERSAIVAAALTRGDLEQVFTDLPQPVAEKPAPAKSEHKFLSDWPDRIMAVIPILALILFLATGHWWFFLAIPLAGALLYGGRHNPRRDERRREHLDRHQDRLDRRRDRLEGRRDSLEGRRDDEDRA
ncbi:MULTISPECIES: DUF1707 domain-containing protein [unclassified Nocardia]|uniref:DUF1707 SHOCT-like domain-containing protein n=1 Tax=unclassified Nocardia TaxID=2637762 RepID=UPI001CE3C4FA|nr:MULTISPECIES: DUF1707 domain-containing protein [unclassified Nocardia]